MKFYGSNNLGSQQQVKGLIEIKSIVDADVNGDKFIIEPREKNKKFMREYGLTYEDAKNIVRKLSVDDFYSMPEWDRDPKYPGWVYKFKPEFEDTILYVKIRVEDSNKSICISMHEDEKS